MFISLIGRKKIMGNDTLVLEAVCELVQDSRDSVNKNKWVKFGMIHQDPEMRKNMQDGELHDICGKIVGETSLFPETGRKYRVTIEKLPE